MVDTLDSITEEIAAECDRDTVGLWEVLCSRVADRAGCIRLRVTRCWPFCGQLLDGQRFVAVSSIEMPTLLWFGPVRPTACFERIRAGYDALGGRNQSSEMLFGSAPSAI